MRLTSVKTKTPEDNDQLFDLLKEIEVKKLDISNFETKQEIIHGFDNLLVGSKITDLVIKSALGNIKDIQMH